MASDTTPIWGRPYPAESDTPDVAADMKLLALSLDTTPLFPTVANSSRTAVAGESAQCSASVTMTLPASPATGDTIRILASGAVSGATPVTVTPGGAKTVYGLGMVGVTTFVLGAPFAHTTLQYDGTHWLVIDGQQDTGWITPALNSPYVNANYGGDSVPQYRVIGNRLELRGVAQNSGGSSLTPGSPTIFTLPGAYHPAHSSWAPIEGTNSFMSALVFPNGSVEGQLSLIASGEVMLNTVYAFLD